MGLVSILKIPFDYSYTPDRVFSLAAAEFLRLGNKLDILSVACNRPGRSSLPSWIPDWAWSREGRDRWLDESLYNASRASLAEVTFVTESSISVLGVQIDTIADVCSSSYHNIQSAEAETAQWENFAGVERQLSGTANVTTFHFLETFAGVALRETIGNADSMTEYFWRLLMLDVSLEYAPSRRAGPEDEPRTAICWEWMRLAMPTSSHRLLTPGMGQRISSQSARHAGRRLLKTGKGYLGVAHQSMQPGDEIWVLMGWNVPFVVRPQGNGSTSKKLISEAYLHGFMDGEALSFEKCEGKQLEACILD